MEGGEEREGRERERMEGRTRRGGEEERKSWREIGRKESEIEDAK